MPGPHWPAQVDAWLSAFAATVVADIELHPHPDLLIGPGEQVKAEAGWILMARAEVTWIAVEGNAAFLGTEEPEANGTGLVPITPESWLTLSKPTSATGFSSQNLHAEGRLVPALAEFHRMALKAEQLNRRLLLADEANMQVSRVAHRRRDEEQAREGLFNILSSSQPLDEKHESTLLAALELIGQYEGIAFKSPSRASRWGSRTIRARHLDRIRHTGSEGKAVVGGSVVARQQRRTAGVSGGRQSAGGALAAHRGRLPNRRSGFGRI